MDSNIINNTLAGQEKTDIEGYVLQLQAKVEEAADAVYFINNFAASTNLKLQQWTKAATSFLRTRCGVNFIAAYYGYAVEEYVNLGIKVGTPAVPNGYRVGLQVIHGQTRPDITISKVGGTEIAWLDITNESSAGHVDAKKGNWLNGRPFIAELLYPDFNASQISVGDDSIASHAAASNITRQANMRAKACKRHLTEKMNAVLSELMNRINKGARIFQADVAQCVEEHFRVRFNSFYKHPIIKSLLQIYLECYDEGGYDVFYAEDAQKCMRVLYNQTGQCKSKAMSFIEESLDNSSIYT